MDNQLFIYLQMLKWFIGLLDNHTGPSCIPDILPPISINVKYGSNPTLWVILWKQIHLLGDSGALYVEFRDTRVSVKRKISSQWRHMDTIENNYQPLHIWATMLKNVSFGGGGGSLCWGSRVHQLSHCRSCSMAILSSISMYGTRKQSDKNFKV